MNPEKDCMILVCIKTPEPYNGLLKNVYNVVKAKTDDSHCTSIRLQVMGLSVFCPTILYSFPFSCQSAFSHLPSVSCEQQF